MIPDGRLSKLALSAHRLYSTHTQVVQRLARACGRCALRSRPGLPCCLHVRARVAPLPCSRPHPLNKTRGRDREHYSSAMQVNRHQGRPIRKHWGKTRNPPAPENHGPVPGLPQTPIPASPKDSDTTRRANDRGKCTAPAAHTAPRLPDEETCKEPGEPGNPHSPVSRFPRTPSRLPPARGRAARARTDSHTAPTTAPTETSDEPADTPAPRRSSRRGKAPVTGAVRAALAARWPCRSPGMPRSARVPRARRAR
jgi:hypothetical protein